MSEIDFTNCPHLATRAYGGANGKKLAVEFEGSAWLLKFPPSAAEKPNGLSYSNSAYSEHLGSTIYRLLIAYCEFIRTSDDPNFRRSLQKLLPRIHALDVEALIADTPYLTALQRDFLPAYLNARRRELFGGVQ